MRRLVLLGGGGHARVVLDAARAMGGFEILGFTASQSDHRELDGLACLGDDHTLVELRAGGATEAIVAVGSIRPGSIRATLYERVLAAGLTAARIVHPAATASTRASIGAGTVIFAHAVVNPGTTIGANVVVNTGAIIEHDCVIADHAHISPGAVLGGGVTVERGAHVGIGAVVLQGRRIGADALVGAGAVVAQDVAPGATVIGIPARSRT